MTVCFLAYFYVDLLFSFVALGEIFCELDAVMVGTPVSDALLDCLRFELLSEGLVDESGQLLIGSEAQRY